MGFAEELEKNKKTVVIVSLLVLVALVVSFMTLRTGGPPRPPGASTTPKSFYTVDDGKTWFPDDATLVPGFDHGGKPAYRAQVYKCGTDGAPFVAYMQRVEEGARKSAEAARAQGKKLAEVEELWQDKIEVKKPGEGKWVPAKGPGEKVMIVTCPEGKVPVIVLP